MRDLDRDEHALAKERTQRAIGDREEHPPSGASLPMVFESATAVKPDGFMALALSLWACAG